MAAGAAVLYGSGAQMEKQGHAQGSLHIEEAKVSVGLKTFIGALCVVAAGVITLGGWWASVIRDDVSDIRAVVVDGERRASDMIGSNEREFNRQFNELRSDWASVAGDLRALVVEVRTSNEFFRENLTKLVDQVDNSNRDLSAQIARLNSELSEFQRTLAVQQANAPAISIDALEALTSALQSPTGEGRVIVVPTWTGQTIAVPPQ